MELLLHWNTLADSATTAVLVVDLVPVSAHGLVAAVGEEGAVVTVEGTRWVVTAALVHDVCAGVLVGLSHFFQG